MHRYTRAMLSLFSIQQCRHVQQQPLCSAHSLCLLSHTSTRAPPRRETRPLHPCTRAYRGKNVHRKARDPNESEGATELHESHGAVREEKIICSTGLNAGWAGKAVLRRRRPRWRAPRLSIREGVKLEESAHTTARLARTGSKRLGKRRRATKMKVKKKKKMKEWRESVWQRREKKRLM